MPTTKRRRGAKKTPSHSILPDAMGTMPQSMNAHQAELMGSAKGMTPRHRTKRKGR